MFNGDIFVSHGTVPLLHRLIIFFIVHTFIERYNLKHSLTFLEANLKILYHTQSSPPYTTLRTSIYVITRNGDEEGVEFHILEVDFEPQK